MGIKTKDTRVAKFTKNESAQSALLKKQGKNLNVQIKTGLDKSTDTTPKNFANRGAAARAAAGAAAGAARGGAARGGRGVPPAGARGPPRPPSKPQAKALYDYDATTADELSFREGDIITILQKDPAGWWEGEFNGQKGWVPANYVQEC